MHLVSSSMDGGRITPTLREQHDKILAFQRSITSILGFTTFQFSLEPKVVTQIPIYRVFFNRFSSHHKILVEFKLLFLNEEVIPLKDSKITKDKFKTKISRYPLSKLVSWVARAPCVPLPTIKSQKMVISFINLQNTILERHPESYIYWIQRSRLIWSLLPTNKNVWELRSILSKKYWVARPHEKMWSSLNYQLTFALKSLDVSTQERPESYGNDNWGSGPTPHLPSRIINSQSISMEKLKKKKKSYAICIS